MVENSEILSTSLKSNILQDPKVICVQKFATCPRNGNFGAFGWKHSQKPLGVKVTQAYPKFHESLTYI